MKRAPHKDPRDIQPEGMFVDIITSNLIVHPDAFITYFLFKVDKVVLSFGFLDLKK